MTGWSGVTVDCYLCVIYATVCCCCYRVCTAVSCTLSYQDERGCLLVRHRVALRLFLNDALQVTILRSGLQVKEHNNTTITRYLCDRLAITAIWNG